MADVDAHLTLVGDGAERNHLERVADGLDVSVTFVGEINPEEVDSYYRAATVFVLPSVEGEGMPNVVLEAMAWGLPVVATDSGAVPSVVEDGITGYVIPMRDPEALAARVSDLLSDPGERERMGTAARAYVRENHSWKWLVGELADVCESVGVKT